MSCKASHPLLIHFQTPTPKEPPTSLEHHPPLVLPYLKSTTFLQKASLFKAYLHNHLPIKALLNITIFLTPSPLETFEEQIVRQLTKWNLNSSPIPPQRKSLWSFSKRFVTPTGIGKRDRKYVGKLERELLIKVNLSPLDKHNLFYPANLASIFSIMLFHIWASLYLAPNGRPKNTSQLLHIPYLTYRNNLRFRQIYSQTEAASKHSSKHLKSRIWSAIGSQKINVSSANNRWDTIIASCVLDPTGTPIVAHCPPSHTSSDWKPPSPTQIEAETKDPLVKDPVSYEKTLKATHWYLWKNKQ
jgi:hypothetical protein